MLFTATGPLPGNELDAHACISNVSHRRREIDKADRLKFKIVPNSLD